LIHLSCFYVGFEEDFMPSYLCPKCGETLLDPDTYHRAGSGYRCSACGSIFHRPKEKWVCIGCRKEFELGETRSEVLSSYKLTKLGIRAAEAYSNGLREIVHVLLGKGLKVSVLGLLQGLSGAKHEYEILAEDDDTYIIGTSLLQEAKATELVKFFSLLHDLQSRGIFIAVPGLDPDAMKVLSDSKVSSRLSLIEASSIPEMKQKLRDFFFSSRSKLPNSIPIAR
jgi:DNA-directed RNA polymerase subunit RPC12/RpoP